MRRDWVLPMGVLRAARVSWDWGHWGPGERIYYWSHETHNVKRVLKFTMGPKAEEQRQRHFHQCRDR
jgi:hypothetical protein